MRILYNVTLKVDHSIHEEWYMWMKTVHIPEVMATGKFSDHRFLKIIGDEDVYGHTYAIQYESLNMETYLEYQQNHAPALQQETKAKYGDKCPAFRTIMEIHE